MSNYPEDSESHLAEEVPYRIAPKYKVPHHMTTTAFALEGFRVIRTLGVVRGITVRSRSLFGTLGATLQTIVGGNITMFTKLCEKTRAEAFEIMLQHASELGANAVVGVRYDATEIMSGVSEVLCYGTAVIVQPLETFAQSETAKGAIDNPNSAPGDARQR
ncbi:MAG: YbjQ family protein [Acidobacteria bacterium]|nr:MAG: YbjQ family protein [Acidobacteriota bacterium]